MLLLFTSTPQSHFVRQLPVKGSLFIANKKLSPFTGKVARSAERGTARRCQVPQVIPLPSRLTPRHLPRKRGRLKLQYKHGVQCRTPRGAIVSMGLRGVQGGLRGEIEIFPDPPAKKYEEACCAFCLFHSLRPLVPLAATSLDREAFSAILYAKVFELPLWLEQGRLTHCRS